MESQAASVWTVVSVIFSPQPQKICKKSGIQTRNINAHSQLAIYMNVRVHSWKVHLGVKVRFMSVDRPLHIAWQA